MKKVIPVSLLLVIFCLGMIRSENFKDQKKKAIPVRPKTPVEKELDFIVSFYDSSAFRALFSLDEFRPNSIISIDKVSMMYDNKWMSPAMITGKLNSAEKDSLIRLSAEFIENYEDKNAAGLMLTKLKYWCMADLQFSFMNKKLGIQKDILIKAIISAPSAAQIVSQIATEQKKGESGFTAENREQAYDFILNHIASLSPKEQYKVYSEVFSQLSVLSSAK